MAKSVKEIESLARNWTDSMLNVLTGIATCDTAPHASRVAAAIAVLDRGWGKPAQTVQGDEENPLNVRHVIERIETVIIDPADTEGENIPPTAGTGKI